MIVESYIHIYCERVLLPSFMYKACKIEVVPRSKHAQCHITIFNPNVK